MSTQMSGLITCLIAILISFSMYQILKNNLNIPKCLYKYNRSQ